MQVRPSRQQVTGLVVNSKINVPSELYKASRSMCFKLFATGTYKFPYIPKKSTKSDTQVETDDIRPIEALLGYIYHIKTIGNQIENQSRTPDEKKSIWKLRFKLLFYKNFVRAEKTIVVCEGKTDNIYLRCAIKQLAPYKEVFAAGDPTSDKRNLSFLNYNKTSLDILKLGNGIDDIKKFIEAYMKNLDKYIYQPLSRPTILIIDNDQGASGIFTMLKNRYNLQISHTSDAPFYYIAKNLYLIKTPEFGQDGQSCIEDLFDPQLLDTKIDNKKFSMKKKHQAESEYGKHIFAEKVIKNNQYKINFWNFPLILDRIGLVEEDYEARKK